MTNDNDDGYDFKFEPHGFNPETGAIVGVRDDGQEGELFPSGSRPMLPGEEFIQITGSEGGALKVHSVYKHKGPSRANSRAYRSGYDAVFGKKNEIN